MREEVEEDACEEGCGGFGAGEDEAKIRGLVWGWVWVWVGEGWMLHGAVGVQFAFAYVVVSRTEPSCFLGYAVFQEQADEIGFFCFWALFESLLQTIPDQGPMLC